MRSGRIHRFAVDRRAFRMTDNNVFNHRQWAADARQKADDARQRGDSYLMYLVQAEAVTGLPLDTIGRAVLNGDLPRHSPADRGVEVESIELLEWAANYVAAASATFD